MLANRRTKDYIWNTLGVGLNAIYSTLLVIVITRFFKDGIELSGKFSYAFYISAVFFTIGSYGGRIYYISDSTNNYTNENYISSKILSGIIMIITALIFCLINSYEINKVLLIMILIIYRFFESISEAYYGIMHKEGKLYQVGKSMTLKSIVSSILFIIAMFLTKNLVLSSLSFIIIFSLTLVIYDMKTTKAFIKSKIIINSKTKEILKKSFNVFLTTFLILVIMNITRYFVDYRLSDSIQGYFSILILPASIINLLANILLQPNLNKLIDYNENKNKKEYKKIVSRLFGELIVIGLIASIAVYYLGPFVYKVLYNLDFSDYRFILALGVMSGVAIGAITILSNLLIIKRKVNIQNYLLSSVIVIEILLSYIFVKDIFSSVYVYAITMFIGCILFYIVYRIVGDYTNAK